MLSLFSLFNAFVILYQVKPLFSPLVWTRLVLLAKKYLNTEKVSEKESVKIDVTEKSKEERTKIHNTVKSTFKHLVRFNQPFFANLGIVPKKLCWSEIT